MSIYDNINNCFERIVFFFMKMSFSLPQKQCRAIAWGDSSTKLQKFPRFSAQWRPIWGAFLKPLGTILPWFTERFFKRLLSWAPMMPRGGRIRGGWISFFFFFALQRFAIAHRASISISKKNNLDKKQRGEHSSWGWENYAQRKLFEILLNQTEVRLYLPCTDWFGTKRTSV